MADFEILAGVDYTTIYSRRHKHWALFRVTYHGSSKDDVRYELVGFFRNKEHVDAFKETSEKCFQLDEQSWRMRLDA